MAEVPLTLAVIADRLQYAGRDRERSVRRLIKRHKIQHMVRDARTLAADRRSIPAPIGGYDMLALRKRGKVYHVRGTVRVGRQIREIKEHSTGCRERAAAEGYKAKLEHEVGQELIHGPAGRARGLTLTEVLLAYVERPGLGRQEVWYAGQIGDVIGDHLATNVVAAWAGFTAVRCKGLAPATVNRFRAVLVAALNHSSVTVPKGCARYGCATSGSAT